MGVDAESSHQTDKASEAFNSRTRRAPRQIVRHDRHGKPLLCSYTRKLLPPTNCKCGAQRSFEFQVMPQLLNLLGSSSTGVLDADIDWGSIYGSPAQRAVIQKAMNEKKLKFS